MAFSTQSAVSDGTLSSLNVSIQYIKQADISVFYNDVPAGVGTYAWAGDTPVINFTPTIPNGVEVRLARATQINQVINRFAAGAAFTNASMDTDFKQMLLLAQEYAEGSGVTDAFADVDFHGFRPINIGTAVNPGDAVSLGQYQADADGAQVARTAAEAAAAAAAASAATAAATLASKANLLAPIFTAQGGAEGGQISLAKPASGTTLAGDVTIDVLGDSLRIFESGGTSRGVYVSLPEAGAGANGKLYHQGFKPTATDISYADPIAPSFLKTVSDIINGDRVSLLRFVDKALHAGLRDGTDPNTDLTTPVQTAFNAPGANGFELYIPAVKNSIRLTAPIVVQHPITVSGAGAAPYVGALGTHGPGSWFQLDHLSVGFSIAGPAGEITSGITFQDVATYRNQPAAAPGWVPLAADYDFVVSNADCMLERVMLLNPTKGINHINGNAGRLTLNHVRGQPFQVGINIDTAYDVFRANDVHWWPFWADLADVNGYTKANLQGIRLQRCDNPYISGYFTIFAQHPIVMSSSVNGVSSRVGITNFGFDGFGNVGLYFEPSAVGAQVYMTNGYFFGADGTGVNGNAGVNVQAPGALLQLSNVRISSVKQQAIVAAAAGTVVQVDNLVVENWNQQNAGFSALASGDIGTINVSGNIHAVGGNGGALVDSGLKITSHAWVPYTPTVTAQTGTITTLGAVTGRYRHTPGQVDYQYSVPITTNGTGAGDIRASLPIVASGAAQGTGRELNITGKLLSATITGTANIVTVANYDNSYPGGDGVLLSISGSYKVA